MFSTRHRRSVPNKSNVLVFVTDNYAVVMRASFTKPYYIVMQVSFFIRRLCGFLCMLRVFWKWDCGCVGGFCFWDRVVRSVAFDRAETQAHDSEELEEDRLLKLAQVTSSRPPLISNLLSLILTMKCLIYLYPKNISCSFYCKRKKKETSVVVAEIHCKKNV